MISRSFERRERTARRTSATNKRYMMRYTRTQHRPASRHVNDHGRVSGTHTGRRTVHSPRQFCQLASVPKAEFFVVLGQGMDAVASHVEILVGAAVRSDDAGDSLAAKILVAIAREEAGKFLVLLDAARIPYNDKARMTSQLKRARNHLAKSLYVEMADVCAATLSGVERYLAEERRSHYLDGPNDADWIFRNRALADREDVMYVDYQETDEGFHWHQPSVSRFGTRLYVSQVCRLVADMHAAGFCDPAGLEVVNRVWRNVVPTNGSAGSDDTHWQDIRSRNVYTLEQLLAAGVVAEIEEAACRRIVDRWTFPLHSLDLDPINTKQSVVDEQRRLLRAALWDASDYANIAAELWEDGPADLARDMLSGFSAEEVDLQVEMRRAREEFVAEERLRFINDE